LKIKKKVEFYHFLCIFYSYSLRKKKKTIMYKTDKKEVKSDCYLFENK